MIKLGIDFGSSYIKCFNASEGSMLKLGKRDSESRERIANIIAYDKNGVPKFATPTILFNFSDDVVINNIKTRLESPEWKENIFGRELSAFDVTADIMKCLYEKIHSTSVMENDYRVVLTSPVCFSARQREIIKRAAAQAGFTVEDVITEPFASLFYLMDNNMDEDHNVLIFDAGGGTIDICLVKIEHKNNSVMIATESAAGMNFGGIKISDCIIDKILLKKYKDKLSPIIVENPDPDKIKHERLKLFYEMENFKEETFSEDYDESSDKPYDIQYYPKNAEAIDMELYVSEIYDMLDEIKIGERIMNLIDGVVEDSSLNYDEITDVFLTGGTTMIPYFRNAVESVFLENGISKDDLESLFALNDGLLVEERTVNAVAQGAAKYGSLKDKEGGDIIIKDKIPFQVYSKNASGAPVTKVSADCSQDGYRSQAIGFSDKQKETGRIEIFQKLYDEVGSEVYIGYVPFSDETVKGCNLYRLGIDKQTGVFAEFCLTKGKKNEAEFVALTRQNMEFEF